MIIKLAQREAFTDSLTEILRSGARALLTQPVEAEVPGCRPHVAEGFPEPERAACYREAETARGTLMLKIDHQDRV